MKTKMTKSRKFLLGTIHALAAPFALPTAARAADHGDAPTASLDQSADIADVFFFRDPNDNTKAILIGTIHGFIVPGEAVKFGIFDPALRYRFEIENTGDATADRFIDVTFSPRVALPGPAGKEALEIPQSQIATVKFPKFGAQFSGKKFTATALNPTLAAAANPPAGAELNPAGTGIQFFAGEVDDPFFFDIPGFARFIASVRNGAPDATQLARGRDSFGGYNILAIAFSIPLNLLTGTDDMIGVRLLTQRRTIETPTRKGTTFSEGPFITVDSMGNPAVNVALLPFNRKNAYNGVPAAGLAKNKFVGDILGTLRALGTTGINPDGTLSGNALTLASVAVIQGDFLRLSPTVANLPTDRIGGGAPTEGSGFPNGRRLRDDTVDILLRIITGNPAVGDGTSASISQVPQTATFPFLAPAQQPFASTDPANPTATDDRTQN